MLVILIIGLTAGPAVSLYGSPTVSPVTAALCASEPLPPKWPSSMYFLALSQAPPPEVIEMATKRPVTITPISIAPTADSAYARSATSETTMKSTIGDNTGSNEGMTISRMAALVSMPTASSASVVLRTSLSRPAISAMPPALSVTGPNASSATTKPARASIVVVAIAMPKRPASVYVTTMPHTMTSAGRAVASIDTARP